VTLKYYLKNLQIQAVREEKECNKGGAELNST
jgi:hypothetical protein